ncbi:helix-turn-helix transcriptional regulator [Methylorubrum populi]|uniref:XRE family transcriptional regulator n=1 Tax=Methylorubrum rhodesianum TaxID=29427 RepID=A0ABU9ZH87_9HYPH|nr:XRE family transcriptional regulator [Methylorubrum rhodesianum]MBK3403909.1 helix-turn-helix transcriptional regulator [Methylorubrum rhodesianum]MBY0143013.1 helix-turn-helix transcriptional regulator [Methylorubrum populi]
MSQVTKFPILPNARKKGEPPVLLTSGAELATVSSAPQESSRTLEKALGHQVRTLRRERDLSLAELGQAAGISLGMLSKIENGQISPSLSTINSIANTLNVPFSSLFSTFEEKRDCSYVRSGQGVIIERGGTKAGHIYELLGASLGGDLVVEPYLITLEEDAEPYTNFRHAGIEFIYMLTGEVMYRHTSQDYHLRPGDSMMFDSAGLHGPVQLVRTPMTYISVIVYPRQPK